MEQLHSAHHPITTPVPTTIQVWTSRNRCSSHTYHHLSHSISTNLWRKKTKLKLIEIKHPLIRKIRAQNWNYIWLQKNYIYCSVEFVAWGCTYPHVCGLTSTAWSSPTVLLIHDFFLQMLRVSCCEQLPNDFYFYGDFFLNKTVSPVSWGAKPSILFYHPALILELSHSMSFKFCWGLWLEKRTKGIRKPEGTDRYINTEIELNTHLKTQTDTLIQRLN